MRALVSLILVAGLCAPAMADLLAYDSITGPDGAITGHQGELNVNSWSQQSGNHYEIANPGLTFGSLVTTGGMVTGGGAYQNSGFTFDVGPSYAPNDLTPYAKAGCGDGRWRIGKEGTTVWASFLIEDWITGDGNRVRFTDSHVGWNAGSYGVGVDVQGGNWHLQDIASGTYTDTGVARTVNETYLMVLKMEFLTGEEWVDAGNPGDWANGADDVTLYVNPTPGLAAPDVVGTKITTSTDFAILNCHFKPGNGYNEGAADEFRLGETYADVTPIPEPMTVALLGLGGLAVLRRRSR